MKNNYGVCCIVLSLEENNQPKKFQKMTYKNFSQAPKQEAISTLSKRMLNNIEVTFSAIKYCHKNNYNYRLSSDLFPLLTYDKAEISLESMPDYEQIIVVIQQARTFLQNNKVRCSMHPDQFVVPASSNPSVVSKSISELEHHAKIMDLFALPVSYESPINIHMNCFKGDVKEISERFLLVYKNLPDNIKKRLVLEVEDKKNSWSLNHLYSIYESSGIPITYDSHHFRLNNPENISPDKAIEKCIQTWNGIKPLFHFSNGKSSKMDRAHSDFVYDVHEELFNHEVDIDFEFKAKNHAIQKYQLEGAMESSFC